MAYLSGEEVAMRLHEYFNKGELWEESEGLEGAVTALTFKDLTEAFDELFEVKAKVRVSRVLRS